MKRQYQSGKDAREKFECTMTALFRALKASSRASQMVIDGEFKHGKEESEVDEIKEREERCHIAIMLAIFAAREVQIDIPDIAIVEE